MLYGPSVPSQCVTVTVPSNDRIDHYVGRLRHAQPVCPPGFAAMIPPVQTPIRGLQIADTCFYYPEDRSITESVRLGKGMAAALPLSVTTRAAAQHG